MKLRNLYYPLAEPCFSEKVLPFPVKSVNLCNLRIETARGFGCGPQAAQGNLRMYSGLS
jgi:hypothetical protein